MMNKKYKKQARVAMTIALAATSIAHSAGNLFAQSEETINENTLTDVEEVKEENIEIEDLESEVEEVLEESLESKESIQHVEKAVGDVTINATNFPNAAFRGYITSFDRNNDGILSSDEIDNITRINIEGNTSITSLKGIEHFPNLTYLNCAYTGVTSLDVSNNLKLEWLNCRNTSVTSLDMSNNLKLEWLSCRNTSVTSLDVTKNTNLTYLNCWATGITMLDVSKNIELRTLYWEANKGPTSIDLSKNLELNSLVLGNILGTALENIDISRNTKLAWVYVGGDSFSGNPNLNVIKSNSVIDLDGMDSTFNIEELYTDIHMSKIENINGANINTSTGIVSGYTFGTPITYKFNCGTDRNGKVYLDVTINVRGKSSIVIDDSLDKVYDGTAVADPIGIVTTGSNGAVTYEWYKADGTQLQAAPTEVGSYKVKAILAEDNQYIGAEVEKEFTITKATSTITINDDLNKVYDGQAIAEPSVTTTGSTGTVTFEWYSADGSKLATAPMNVGSYKVKAILADDANHIGAEVEETFAITKANSTIIINDNLNKVYDGIAVVEPTDIVTTGSTGTVSFEWYTADGTKLATAPVNVGSYKVKAILAGDSNHDGVEVEKEFTIGKAVSTITINDDLNKTYDGQVVADPSVTAIGSTGAVSFEWYTADGTKLQTTPVNVGSYKVKAILAEDTNYVGSEVEKEFTISPAGSSVTITVELDKEYDGQPVLEPQVSVIGSTGAITYEWYKKEESTTRATTWTKLATAPSEVGNYKVVVTVAGDGNYEAVTVEKEFSISGQATVVPTPGTGGSITNPDGSITFPNGGTVTKPDGSVVIIQPGTTTIPGQVTGVQTGDGTQVGLWTMLVGLSTGMMMFFRRKNRKEEV